MTSDCWEWTGSKDRCGYGVIWFDQHYKKAHRVAYLHIVGPIPEGLVLDHLCRNPACVRPDHLEPVTVWENTRRGTGPLAKNSAATHCPKGHEYSPGNTYVHSGKRSCRECRRVQARDWKRRRKETAA